MNLSREIERLLVRITYTVEIENPFVADFEFESFTLDVSNFQLKSLEEIESLTIKPIDTLNQGNDNLLFIAIFNCKIRKDNKIYLDYIEKRDTGGPLGYDKMTSLKKDVSSLVIDLIKYIGWRKNLSIFYNQFDKLKIDVKWGAEDMSSEDQLKTTHQFRNFEHFYLTTENKVHIAPVDFKDFYDLQGEMGAIPLHHELIIEVDRLRKGQYNRSAYLMLYTTLEVATKGLIRHRKPDATWLINNTPSPNLFKMYNEFINKEISSILNNNELKMLQDMTSKRNNVAHKGEMVQTATLEKHFAQIKLWLNKIDFAFGYEWVKSNI